MSAAIWLSYLFTYRRRRFLRRAYPAHLGVTIGCMPYRCHPNSSSRHQPPFAPTKFYYQSPFRSAIWPKLSANRYFHTFLAPPLFQILVMVYYYYSPKVSVLLVVLRGVSTCSSIQKLLVSFVDCRYVKFLLPVERPL